MIQLPLIDAMRALPLTREITHCGNTWRVSPFDFYATCTSCGARFKIRSLSGLIETEDLFDAAFEWMSQPGAEAVANRRRAEIAADQEEGHAPQR